MAVNGYAAAQDVADLKTGVSALALTMGTRVGANEDATAALQATVDGIPAQLDAIENAFAVEINARLEKGANLSDLVDAATARANLGADQAANVLMVAPGGGVSRSLLENAKDVVHATQYGVVPGGTASANGDGLLAAVDYAIAAGRKLVIKGGTYNVDKPISAASSYASVALHLFLDGDVVINYTGATSHEYFLCAISNALNPHSITGGSLTINGNNKIQRGVSLSSNSGGTVAGAYVLVTANVRVINMYAPSGSNGVAYAMDIAGPFSRVLVADFSADKAERHSSLDATGDCKGLRITQVLGPVLVARLDIRRILNPLQDADGIAVFGGLTGTTPKGPLLTVLDSYFEDCQGRSIKTQLAHTIVLNTRFVRKAYKSITNGHDVDAQYGSLYMENWYCEYRNFLVGDVVTSPVGDAFIPFMIQALYNDAPKHSYIGRGTLLSDAVITCMVFCKVGANSARHDLVVDGAVVQGINGYTGGVLNRCLVEFDILNIKATTKPVSITVRNTVAQHNLYIVGYTGGEAGDGAAIAGKLSVNIDGNRTTMAAVGNMRPFQSLSGVSLDRLDGLRIGTNPGYHQVLTGAWRVDMNALEGDTEYHVDASTVTIVNGPPASIGILPTTGYMTIRTGQRRDGWFNFGYREIVVHDTGTRYFTVDGSVWRSISPTEGVSVKDFGAKGDGVANDTAAFNAALAASKVVLVPTGTYRASGITCSGHDRVMIADSDAVIQKNANGDLITFTGNDPILRGVALYDDVNFTGHGFVFTSTRGPSLIECGASGIAGRCVKSVGSRTRILGTKAGWSWTTTDLTASGYEFEIGSTTVPSLYHHIADMYTSHHAGGGPAC